MIKVMHVITTLGPAGAETMLCRVVGGMDSTVFQNEAVSLIDILHLAENLRGSGARVRTLGMKRRGTPNPLLVMRLAKWIRESKPDVIHTWMYHSNLIGSLAARLAGNVPVVWGVHHSGLDPRVDKNRTVWVNRACARLSHAFPKRIVFCSEASMEIHKGLGYALDKLEVIPNGFDLDRLKPEPSAYAAVRQELGIPSNAPLIGIVARFHPQKDHRNFLRAAAEVRKHAPHAQFLLCGYEVTWDNKQLVEWVDAAGLRDCCHLIGVRQDLPRIFAALDVLTTSSLSGEAFPMVIGEAMACGTPCVVTDVGDSALIVGDTGAVVPPGDSASLAIALRKLIEMTPESRNALGAAARQRVQDRFSLPMVVGRYGAIYAELARGARPNLTCHARAAGA